MLEANTFRSYLMIGGIMVFAVLLYFLFSAPLVAMDDSHKADYENAMNVSLEDRSDLTVYEALLFLMEAKSRAKLNHY